MLASSFHTAAILFIIQDPPYYALVSWAHSLVYNIWKSMCRFLLHLSHAIEDATCLWLGCAVLSAVTAHEAAKPPSE